MTTLPIVVGIDGSPVAEAALLWAAHAAQAWDRELLIVLAGDVADPADIAAGSPNPSADMLTAAEHTVRRAGITCRIRTLLHDQQPEPLLETLSSDASLLVAGAGPEGRLSSFLFGSVSGHLLAHARCPVVTVPAEWIDRISPESQSVVVGIKPTPGGEAALRFALSYAQATGARVLALRCWDRGAAADPADPLAERDVQLRVLDTMVDAVTPDYPFVRVYKQLSPGPVHDALRFAALSADLLVVGTRFATGARGSRLGPIAGRVTRRMPCPVAVVSAPSDTGSHDPGSNGTGSNGSSQHAGV